MPTGFDVETGCNLSPKLDALANPFLEFLKAERSEHQRGPGNPISATGIIAWAYDIRLVKIKDSDVRAIVNFLRRNRQPIGSNKDGYFYALNVIELQFTLQHLGERVSAIRGAYEGLSHSFDHRDQLLF